MADQNRISPLDNPLRYTYGSNNLGAKDIHTERLLYKFGVFPDDLIVNSMDTWSVDRFYGIVDTKGNTVLLDETYLKPLHFTGGESQFVLDFVADAWYDLATRLRDLADQNIIYRNSP